MPESRILHDTTSNGLVGSNFSGYNAHSIVNIWENLTIRYRLDFSKPRPKRFVNCGESVATISWS